MISMHCPSCGAEGRIPEDKFNVRMLCKRCLKSFHLRPDGRIVAGSPPESDEDRHVSPLHELDAVEQRVDAAVDTLKAAAPRLAVLLGILAVVGLAWTTTRLGSGVGGLTRGPLESQATRVARAMLKDSDADVRALAVEGTGDDASVLYDTLRPGFGARSDSFWGSSAVEVARDPEPSGPGLWGVVATIRTDQPAGGTGEDGADASPGSVEVPMILAGDDKAGWRLDGTRSLEIYKLMHPAATAPETQAGSPRPNAATPRRPRG